MRFDEPRRASGRAETDWLKASPQGGFARHGKVINITEDVRKYAAEQGISDDVAIQRGMENKSEEFTKMGGKIYSKV